MNNEEFCGIMEAAKILGVSPRTTYNLFRRGKIRGYRVSGCRPLRFKRSHLQQLAQPEEVTVHQLQLAEGT